MFSIIIPTLNEESLIAQTITQFDNIKNKYEIEIIVADSMSTDNTVEIAKRYTDKVVVYAKSDLCNISKARNFGALKAKNDVLIFLDSDIIIKNTELFMKKVINVFKDKKIIATTPKILVDPKEETLSDKIVHWLISVISNILNNIGFGYSRGGCQIVKSKYFNKIDGYNEAFIAGEDVDLFRRLRQFGKTSISNNITVYESPRRYRKFGYMNVLFNWFMNWFYTLVLKKSFSTKW